MNRTQGGPRTRSGRFGEEKNLLYLLIIVVRFPGRDTVLKYAITVLTEVTRLYIDILDFLRMKDSKMELLWFECTDSIE
jgi:hypothetical protein